MLRLRVAGPKGCLWAGRPLLAAGATACRSLGWGGARAAWPCPVRLGAAQSLVSSSCFEATQRGPGGQVEPGWKGRPVPASLSHFAEAGGPARALVPPSTTLREGYLLKRKEEPAGLGTRFAFKKRYFRLSGEDLSYAKGPEWQVGLGCGAGLPGGLPPPAASLHPGETEAPSNLATPNSQLGANLHTPTRRPAEVTISCTDMPSQGGEAQAGTRLAPCRPAPMS